MNIKENYQQYVSRYAAEVAALKRKNTGFITGELLAFGGILAFLICYFAIAWRYAELSDGGGAVPDCLSGNQTT